MSDITKAAVNLGRLQFTFEGSEPFVSAQIEKFAPLILAHASVDEPGDSTHNDPLTHSSNGSNGAGEQKRRKARATSGAGQGCAAKVGVLLTDQFFETGKNTTQIAAELKQRATPYAKNKISAALIGMAKARKLRRYQEGGEWLYIVP